jgi:hypothetical protein
VHTVITLNLSYWNLIVTMALPALVALVTKRFAPGHVKALALVGLSILGGLLNQIIAQGGSFQVGQTLWYIAITFGGAVLVHFGLLGPAAITGAFGAIAKNMPGGLGPRGTDKAPVVTVPVVVTPAAPEPPVTGSQ